MKSDVEKIKKFININDDKVITNEARGLLYDIQEYVEFKIKEFCSKENLY